MLRMITLASNPQKDVHVHVHAVIYIKPILVLRSKNVHVCNIILS
jgi:hypothetical protein